jgi:hypothetical protein
MSLSILGHSKPALLKEAIIEVDQCPMSFYLIKSFFGIRGRSNVVNR